MRKCVLILCLLVLGASVAQAQTWGEWFRQKKTQKKYLLQQIAALKAYSEVLQKGYGIARGGLNTVRDFTDGEFQLHDLFFKSLRNVSPAVRRYGRVADIIDLQIQTVRTTSRHLAEIRRSRHLSTGEIAYLNEVFKRLLDDCYAVVDELIVVVSAGGFELTDDQRLLRIDMLYSRASDQRVFAEQFGQESLLLDLLRLREINGVDVLGRMYGPVME